ncbi:hypothetical protein HHK36_016353 [Tetracentron sinense]|uniref:non-specific serine/threonine protein kinase n=1 Tax=Tetracentron sinense TaxID=13715 RepID=A0A834Z2L4_TETSI|nr:hypothetical protein HHK36_016353 [Tetracentron sinense]
MSCTIHLMLFLLVKVAASNNNGFTFNGNWKLDGVATVAPDGLFRLTNLSTFGSGHAFYSLPLGFKNTSNGNALSFSTTFVFGINPEKSPLPGHGMAFAISPSKGIDGASSSQHLGLFNRTNNGDTSNHIIAIEFDTFQNQEFDDIDGNHVGIDINGLKSVLSSPAGYFRNENGEFENITLGSGKEIQGWVDYDGVGKQLNVTLSPIDVTKPNLPLLSLNIDISSIILDQMYVGFSASTGRLVQSHYVLGWSFQLNGKAPDLDLSRLPSLPLPRREQSKKKQLVLAIGLSITALVSVLTTIAATLYFVRRRAKFTEVLEDWEVQYGPHRFSYKDLFMATKGFKDTELLGSGGFGRVYKGVLPTSSIQVAVKRVSHESKQGMREFVAEIATIGRLRHPNLVRLLGYCRQKEELLLVYDFMPNSSLDKFLFNQPKSILNWDQRFRIIKDVASGLVYLHEEWVQVVVHRDIKASNVLLDSELNGRLGDFGLARLSSHGMDPQTTHVAGTLGYIAPELARTGKATTSTDVFAFGAFCLEVACGRKPVLPRASQEQVLLVDWVSECWEKGNILKTVDPKLGNDFVVEEMELVLKLGLVCSNSVAVVRPSMSRVMQYLKGDASLPDDLDAHVLVQNHSGSPCDFAILHDSHPPSLLEKNSSRPSLTITESFLSRGR